MSSSIWTRCGGAANVRALAARAHRCVEAQHVVGTRKLVDSAEEQELLERLIERQKPPLPDVSGMAGLHYLLATSFRYPPLRHGSRFGTRTEPSLWYGAETLRTAFAESAYYRLLFIDGIEADIGPIAVEWTTFEVALRTPRAVDLAVPPFRAHKKHISSPVAYDASQALGRAMRADGVVAFRYVSARDRAGGCNFGVFEPSAFAVRRPSRLANWHCTAVPSRVEIFRKDVLRRETFVFEREEFEVAGRLPAPAL